MAVSDHRISYDDLFPATEYGANKIVNVADGWFVCFSATDVSPVLPLMMRISQCIGEKRDAKEVLTILSVMQTVADAYSFIREQEFTNRHLRAIGYGSMQEFKIEGLSNLGRDQHQKYMDMLYQYDLGVELIVFGNDDKRRQNLFTVHNPGRVIERGVQGFAAIGSGAYLALGALYQKPIPFNLVGTIYRLLEAKFVAASATYVGQTTNMLVLDKNGNHNELSESEAKKVRAI